MTTIIGLILGYYLHLIYKDHCDYKKHLKALQEETERRNDPDYWKEETRIQLSDRVWVINKFGDHITTIMYGSV